MADVVIFLTHYPALIKPHLKDILKVSLQLAGDYPNTFLAGLYFQVVRLLITNNFDAFNEISLPTLPGNFI